MIVENAICFHLAFQKHTHSGKQILQNDGKRNMEMNFKMRTRISIEQKAEHIDVHETIPSLQLEVLLDIRDILLEKK